MSSEAVFALVDRIYGAAVCPDRWQDFVEDLSRELGGATGAMALRLPGTSQTARYYRVDVRLDLEPVFERHYARGLPWARAGVSPFRERFVHVSDVYSDADLARSDFFTEWMAPHGLAPEGPVGIALRDECGRPTAGFAFFRKVGGRRFTREDLRLGDLLAPHLERAMDLYYRFGGAQHERLALAEVMNRLPVGVMLVDRDRRRVASNRSADRLIALDDGLAIVDSRLRAVNRRDDGVLQDLLGDAIAGAAGHMGEALGEGGGASDRVMAISRPSGLPAFPIVVSPLLEGGAAGDAVAAVLFGDPDGGQRVTREIVQSAYRLTPAEAELVSLLAEGCSLEDAAKRRGVALNTVRSQLKRVFAKTETRRQGELVRLVLTGAASFEGDQECDTPDPSSGRSSSPPEASRR